MRVAFLPSAPFLLPGLGGGPKDLRFACLQAISTLDGPVTVLGAATTDGPIRGSVDATPWGARGRPTADALPLALAVGASLLEGREHTLVGIAPRSGVTTGTAPTAVTGVATVERGPRSEPQLAAAEIGDAAGDLVLTGSVLVVADGTATRTEKAPGHFDARAEPFDVQVEKALAAGDPEALLALDPALAAELWVGGLATWQAAARALQGHRWRGEVLWSGAPFGVYYAVATWCLAD